MESTERFAVVVLLVLASLSFNMYVTVRRWEALQDREMFVMMAELRQSDVDADRTAAEMVLNVTRTVRTKLRDLAASARALTTPAPSSAAFALGEQEEGHRQQSDVANIGQKSLPMVYARMSRAVDLFEALRSGFCTHVAEQTMRTMQLTEEKMEYELKNMIPLQHPFPMPPKPIGVWNSQQAAQGRGNILFGMSSVPRSQNYLLQTLHSLVQSMSAAERTANKIVVFNAMAPPEKHTEAMKVCAPFVCAPLRFTFGAFDQIREAFPDEMRSGLIEVITLPSNNNNDGHSQLQEPSRLKLRWGDPLARVQWRAKHVLDTAFVMDYAYRNRSKTYDYYVHLEDDILVSRHAASKLRGWIDSQFASVGRSDWTLLSFYNPWRVQDKQALKPYNFFGVIGQAFRLSDLPTVCEFLRRNFDESPLDWLFVDLLTKYRGQVRVHTPSLFQHVGVVSSLMGKTQLSKAVDFAPD